ncbi:MAG: MOSC domain-containing protein [Chloroflexi bacterium]|nr:MOSC domain-containing protein [Chloroflexota bacterium]
MASQGTVVAVCLRPDTGVPKYPQREVVVGQLGIDGDFHAGPINKHKKTGPLESNRRQVTIVARESLDAVSKRLGIVLGPGALGENVLVGGLGDLSGLVEGDTLLVGGHVALRVTGQNRPCATLAVYHKDIVAAFTGIRGVTAVVVSPGVVKPGDSVRLQGQ